MDTLTDLAEKSNQELRDVARLLDGMDVIARLCRPLIEQLRGAARRGENTAVVLDAIVGHQSILVALCNTTLAIILKSRARLGGTLSAFEAEGDAGDSNRSLLTVCRQSVQALDNASASLRQVVNQIVADIGILRALSGNDHVDYTKLAEVEALLRKFMKRDS